LSTTVTSNFADTKVLYVLNIYARTRLYALYSSRLYDIIIYNNSNNII